MGNCCAVNVPAVNSEKEVTLNRDEDEEEEDDDDDYVDEVPEIPNYHQKGGRSSVSAEAYGDWNKKSTNFQAPKYPKTEDQKQRIRKALSQAFMFAALEESDLVIVIDAFKEEPMKTGAEVIKQYDEDADRLFLIEKGQLAVFKRSSKDEPHPGKEVFTYQDSGVFGELALLYNCPRAATVRAKTDSLLWSIDRETFGHLVKDAASKKRDLHDSFLKSVKLLESLDPYERSKIADALRTRSFKAGETIIAQGTQGSEFFMLEDGQAQAFKDGNKVMDYNKSDYFGELSLLKDQPRAADVKAKTDCRVAVLERAAFKRLLGPLDTILESRAKDLYNQVNK